MQAIPTRPGLVDEPQLRGLPLEAANQPVDVSLACPDLPAKHRLIGAAARRMRDRDRILVHVQPDEQRSRLGPG